MRKFLALGADILTAAVLLAAIWIANYLIPQQGIPAGSVLSQTQTESGSVQGSPESGTGSGEEETDSGQALSAIPEEVLAQRTKKLQELVDAGSGTLETTRVKLDTQDWHQKFAEHFTDGIVMSDTSYTSPDLSIHLTYDTVKTGRIDRTEGGKHQKYGTNISYVLADIYVGDITCLQTGFAQDTYGVGYLEKLVEMSDRMQSVLAVNGDSYSNSRHVNNGTIVRNGVIYRERPTDMETCVLNWDGTMKIYAPGELETRQLKNEGAYQTWIFGPSLLDENGKAKTEFRTWDYIRESHPRTAIGYYEPGHYCLLVLDGRQSSTRGMFLDEMAALFESLGCRAAYNLDGGHCSFMTMGTQVVSHPYSPEQQIQDGIFLMEAMP